MKFTLSLRNFAIFLVLTFVNTSFLFAQTEPPQFFSLDGRLFEAGSTTDPLLDSSVVMTVQVLNPSKSCILYEEQQTVNTLGTNGYFNVRVGSGTGATKRSSLDTNNSMNTVFYNRTTAINGKTSGGGACTYTPAAGDERFFRFFITPSTVGSTAQLSPDMTLDSVPQAIVAQTLQGLGRDDVFHTSVTSTQAKLDNLLTTNYTNITDLISGTSTQYLRNAATGTLLPTRATDPAAPTAGQMWYDSATNEIKYYNGTAVTAVGAAGSGISSITAGSGLDGGTITTSGTISVAAGGITDSMLASGIDAAKVTTGTLPAGVVPSGTDSSKLPLAGGTLTGAVTMGAATSFAGFDLLGTGHITMNSQRTITIGRYDGGQQTTLIGTLGPANAGATWFNSTTGKLMFWNGSAAFEISETTSAGGDITAINTNAGSGLTGGVTSGPATLAINVDGTTLEVATNTVQVKDGGIALVKLSADSVNSSKIVDDSITSSDVNDGTLVNADINAAAAIAWGKIDKTGATAGDVGAIPTTRAVNTNSGSGLTGGGALSADRSLSIVVDDSTIEIATNTVQVKDGGITNNKIASVNITKLTQGAGDYFSYMPAGTECATGEVLKWNATSDRWLCDTDAVGATDHGALTGLADDDHTQYVLLAGRSGGQTLRGGTASGENLVLESTSNVTKGDVLLQPNGGNVGVGTANANKPLEVWGTGVGILRVGDTAGGNSSDFYPNGASTVISNNNTGAIRMWTNGLERMTLAGSGNVGIGTTSPNSLLDVAGVIRAQQICDEAGANCKDISSGWGAGGDIDGITTNAGSALSGGTASGTATLSVVTDATTIETNGSNQLQIKDAGVTLAKMAANSVNSSKIVDDSITSADVNDGTLVNADINAAAAIAWSKIDKTGATAADVGAVPTTRAVNTNSGSGLTGGGALSADRNIALNVDNSTIEIATNTVQVKDGGITNAKISSLNITKLTQGAGDYFSYMPAGVECATGEVLKWNAITDRWLCDTDAVGSGDHGALTGLADDDHTQYVLLAGRAGGQNLIGGTASGDDLTIESTSNATKGDIILQPNGGNIGIGTSTPASNLHINIATTGGLNITDSDAAGSLLRFGEGASGAGVFFPVVSGRPVGSSLFTGIYSTIDPAEDTGTIPTMVFTSRRETPAVVTTRPLFQWRNNSTGVMTIDALGNVGIGTAAPTTKLDVEGTIQIGDGGETCSVAANAGMVRYSAGTLQYCNGSAWQTLGVSGAGLTTLNAQTGSTQTFATGTTGTAPAFSSASNVHTLNIPLASGAGVTSGTITKAQYDSFVAKLSAVTGSSLTSARFWVGDGSNLAQPVLMSGDATMSNTGAVTIANDAVTSAKIAADTIVAGDIATGAVATAEILDGTIATADIANTAVTDAKINTVSVSKITSAISQYLTYAPNGTSCAVGQVLKWQTLTGWECAADAGATDHGALTGLTDDDHTQYVMLAGRAGGQTVRGGTASGETLTLESTSDATKGALLLQPNGGLVGIGTTSPAANFQMHRDANGTTAIAVTNPNAGASGTATFSATSDVAGAVLRANSSTASSANPDVGRPSGVALFTNVNATGGLSLAARNAGGIITLHSGGGGAASERMRIDASGNIGIGTTAPTQYVEILKSQDAPTWTNVSNLNSGTAARAGVIASAETATGSFWATSEAYSTIAGVADSVVLGANTDASGGLILYAQTGVSIRNTLSTPTSGIHLIGTEVGIGTTAPAAKLDVEGTIQIGDSGETCTVAANAGMVRYAAGTLQYCNGSAWQTLGVSGAGLTTLNSQTGSTQTFATGATGTAPAFSSASNVHTLNIPLASGAGVTSGTITKAQYDSFVAKLSAVTGSSLTSARLWVGDGSNLAQPVLMSGDATMSNTGAVTIANDAITSAKIAADTIVAGDIATGAVATAEILDGTIATADIANAAVTDAKINTVSVNKITSAITQYLTYAPNGTSCAVGQVLKWQTLTGWECAADSGATDHGALTGLTDDDHSQYALLTGRAGGQTLRGGTAASNDLILESTSNATKGEVLIQTGGGNVGIGTTAASNKLVVGDDSLGALATPANTIAIGNASGSSAVSLGQGPTNRVVLGWSYNATPASAFALLGSGNGANALVLQHNGGNVGIGTTAPGNQLSVYETATGYSYVEVNHAGAVATGNGEGLLMKEGAIDAAVLRRERDGAGTLNLLNAGGSINIGTGASIAAATTKVTILSGGNVGIGSTSPGQKLTVAGTVESTSGGFRFPDGSVQTKAASGIVPYTVTVITTSNAAWAPQSDTVAIEFEVQGGGGGSGGADGQGAGTCAISDPGNAGGYAKKLVYPVTGTYNIQVGAAGAGGAGAAGNGTAGGASSVTGTGVNVVANGGSGGSGQTGSGGGLRWGGTPGGTATGGDLNIPGSPTTFKYKDSAGTCIAASNGGDSFLGRGGVYDITANNAIQGGAASGYGGGGGSSTSQSVTNNAAGAAGTQGVVIVREYRPL